MTLAQPKRRATYRPHHLASNAHGPITRVAACSSAAGVVERMVRNMVAAQADSQFLGIPSLRTMSELRDAYAEASESDWDGYGAQPADPASFFHARRFLMLQGLGQQPTDVSVDPDGEVSLNWDFEPDRVLSISVAPDGRLSYAARLGPNRVRGIEVLLDEIPEAIVALIRRVIRV